MDKKDNKKQYKVRNLRHDEIGLLKDFLYEAIYVPEGVMPCLLYTSCERQRLYHGSVLRQFRDRTGCGVRGGDGDQPVPGY